MTKASTKKNGARIPERAKDMPGGPHGGKAITPPKTKKGKKKSGGAKHAD